MHNPSGFDVHTAAKYLNRNVSIGLLVCCCPIHFQICCSLCTVKAKVSTKNSNREVPGASDKNVVICVSR